MAVCLQRFVIEFDIYMILQVHFKPSADGPATSWHEIFCCARNGQRPILCPEHHLALLDGTIINHSPEPVKVIASSRFNKGPSGMIAASSSITMRPGDTLKSKLEAR